MSSYLERLSDLAERRTKRRRRTKRTRVASRSAALVPAAPESVVRLRRRPATHVQSLLFRRDAGWTVSKAKAWAKRHGYRYGDVDATDQYIRLRQESPGRTKIKRTVDFGKGIRAVVGREGKEGARTMARKRGAGGRFVAETRRHKRRKSAEKRRRRRRASESWYDNRAGHRKASKKGWRRRRRAAAPMVAAPPRRRRRRRSRATYESTRRRRRRASAPRRRRSREVAYTVRARYRRRHARSNPMRAGELALAVIASGLGYALADFADRYMATYDNDAVKAGAAAPTNKFTSTNGTLANTLNIATTPGLMRIGVGLGVTVLPGLVAPLVRGSMAKSALHGMMIGAGVKLFSTLFNGYVMGNLLKNQALGARLYPAEITAAQNIAAGTTSGQPSVMLGARPQAADPGPFALAQAPAAPVGGFTTQLPGTSSVPGQIGPSGPQVPSGAVPAGGPSLCPQCSKVECGCLGEQQPATNGAAAALGNLAYVGLTND